MVLPPTAVDRGAERHGEAARPLTGKVVAITGGGRGIGRATARALAGAGMRVAIGDLEADLAGAAANELGGDAIGLPLDVTDRASFAAFLDEVEQRLGPVDVLVNNAGIMPIGRFWDESDETALRMVDINVHGVLFGMKLVLPKMVARRSGHIVNLASQAGKVGLAGGATYCATKHAVVGVSEAVRAELAQADANVEISCVMPAFVATELISGLEKVRGSKTSTPEDVAAAILGALQHPRFDVYVPRENGAIFKAVNLLPRGAREAMGRAMGADRALAHVADPGRRAGYEARAARSEPARPAGDGAPRASADGAPAGAGDGAPAAAGASGSAQPAEPAPDVHASTSA
jgi:NADP-dependent 3-hydroxy acid dehydrogenase YdfG